MRCLLGLPEFDLILTLHKVNCSLPVSMAAKHMASCRQAARHCNRQMACYLLVSYFEWKAVPVKPQRIS